MAYTSTAFGATSEYSVYHPDTTRLFVFSPYFLEVTTETAGQTVTITSNSISLSRVSNASKKAKFPISRLIQTFFSGVNLGVVSRIVGIGTYVNTGSNLVQEDKTIVIQVGSDENTHTLTYDMLFGAIQAGEIETTVRDIYVWYDGSKYLYKTITDNIGDDLGHEILIDSYLNDEYPTQPATFVIMDGATLMRTYNIHYMPYCAGGVQLRWISPEGEYDDYYFKVSTIGDNIEEVGTVKQNVWSFDDDAIATGVVALSDKILSKKKASQVIEVGIPTADYEQQIALIKLQRSIRQWVKAEGVDNWIEVIAEVDPIIIDRFRSNQEINVKITKPSLYLQSI